MDTKPCRNCTNPIPIQNVRCKGRHNAYMEGREEEKCLISFISFNIRERIEILEKYINYKK